MPLAAPLPPLCRRCPPPSVAFLLLPIHPYPRPGTRMPTVEKNKNGRQDRSLPPVFLQGIVEEEVI